jgi:hypothetical protein
VKSTQTAKRLEVCPSFFPFIVAGDKESVEPKSEPKEPKEPSESEKQEKQPSAEGSKQSKAPQEPPKEPSKPAPAQEQPRQPAPKKESAKDKPAPTAAPTLGSREERRVCNPYSYTKEWS